MDCTLPVALKQSTWDLDHTTSDFNRPTLRICYLHTIKHISCLTRCWKTRPLAYDQRCLQRSIPGLHLGESDHLVVLLLPAYKNKLKWEDPVQKVMQCWSEETDETLRDRFVSVEWSICKDSMANLSEYATPVTDVNSKCAMGMCQRQSYKFYQPETRMNCEVHSHMNIPLMLKSATFKPTES